MTSHVPLSKSSSSARSFAALRVSDLGLRVSGLGPRVSGARGLLG